MPSSPRAAPDGYGAAVRNLAPQPIVQAFFMLVYAVWWILAWPILGTAAFVLAVGYAVAITVISVRNIRHSRRFENEPSEEGARIAGQMGWVLGITYGIVWAAGIALAVTGNPRWIMPVVALVIALHFLPLARIFERRIDYLIAPVALLFAVLGLWLAGRADVDWQVVYAVTGIGGAVATGTYAAYLLHGYRQLATAPR